MICYDNKHKGNTTAECITVIFLGRQCKTIGEIFIFKKEAVKVLFSDCLHRTTLQSSYWRECDINLIC